MYQCCVNNIHLQNKTKKEIRYWLYKIDIKLSVSGAPLCKIDIKLSVSGAPLYKIDIKLSVSGAPLNSGKEVNLVWKNITFTG